MGCRTRGLSDKGVVGQGGCRTGGLSDKGVIGQGGCRTRGLSEKCSNRNDFFVHVVNVTVAMMGVVALQKNCAF